MEHVIRKHSTRAVAREFGGRAFLSLFSINDSGTPAALQAGVRLAGLGYQRDDEADADRRAVGLLAKAGIANGGLSAFLRRLQNGSRLPGGMTFLSTHPATEDRIKALEQEEQRSPGSQVPLSTPTQWRKERDVCAVSTQQP
jgi:predicted Zn-dependent protease